MTSRSSNAYVLSAVLHGAVVAAIFLLAYMANQSVMNAPKVFELVAGSGNDYMATEAPNLGVPGGIKVTIPDLPAPSPAVEPAHIEVAPPPEPVAPAAVEPAPAPIPAEPVHTVPVPTPKAQKTPAKTDAIPNLTKIVQRRAARKAASLERAYEKQLKAEQRKKMTYDQYLKDHKLAAGSSAASARLAKLAAEGDRLGIAGSNGKSKGAGSHAATREDGSALDAYFALLKARCRENFVAPADVSDKLVAKVSFYLGADGSISQVHIETSSGNGAFDRAVVDAFRHTRGLPPRPDGHGEEVRLSFSMREEEAG